MSRSSPQPRMLRILNFMCTLKSYSRLAYFRIRVSAPRLKLKSEILTTTRWHGCDTFTTATSIRFQALRPQHETLHLCGDWDTTEGGESNKKVPKTQKESESESLSTTSIVRVKNINIIYYCIDPFHRFL